MKLRHVAHVVAGGALAVLLAAPAALAQQQTQTQPPQAQQLPAAPAGQALAAANFVNPQGQPVGSAALVETPAGVLIQVEMKNIPPGLHGFHVHETGTCTAPDFRSAGGHYNPTGREHGYLGAQGGHAGDLPNLSVGSDGSVRADILVDSVSLGTGANSLFKPNGTALVLHAGPDDYRTNPAGNSGDRIACAVIERQTRP